jgi:hypothetical protein
MDAQEKRMHTRWRNYCIETRTPRSRARELLVSVLIRAEATTPGLCLSAQQWAHVSGLHRVTTHRLLTHLTKTRLVAKHVLSINGSRVVAYAPMFRATSIEPCRDMGRKPQRHSHANWQLRLLAARAGVDRVISYHSSEQAAWKNYARHRKRLICNGRSDLAQGLAVEKRCPPEGGLGEE